MRLQPVDSLSLTRPSMVEYFLLAIRLVHGVTAILPGLLLLFYLRDQHPEATKSYFAVLIFFGVVSVLFFQALGVYAENIFSNRWRLQLTLFAWSAAFCLLLFMHRALDLFNFISNAELVVWYLGSLVLFGVERMILLTLFKRLMSRGIFLQQAVILGATENGVRLAEYLAQHQDIRSGVIGFVDDRVARLPDTVAHLPLLGNTQDLEKMIREEKVTQILVALPWSAENRLDYIIRNLRKFPVNVLLVPDMIAFRHAHNRISEVANLPMFNASEVPLRG